MTNNGAQPNNIFSANDALDINELASLNDDISPELIEQLQNQLTQNAIAFSDQTSSGVSDADLFEEVSNKEKELKSKNVAPSRVNIDDSIDDNFIKKYKARLNKEAQPLEKKTEPTTPNIDVKIDEEKNLQASIEKSESVKISQPQEEIMAQDSVVKPDGVKLDQFQKENEITSTKSSESKIENLTSGNIIERPLQDEQVKYNESLDFLDNNVKYSKYVIYIDPENVEFIESLTVKERKNLINKILREQDDIALSNRRFNILKSSVKHITIAVITIALAVPFFYHLINFSLESSINNYRKSQTAFQTLYKDKGKIKQIKKH